MTVKKVDLDQQGWTYASYVIAGDYLFTSICTGRGTTLEEQVEAALLRLQRYLRDAGATLDDVVKVTVTLTTSSKVAPASRKYRCSRNSAVSTCSFRVVPRPVQIDVKM